MDVSGKITNEQLKGWLTSPLTVKVFDILRRVRQDHQDALLQGQTLNAGSVEATALQTTLLLGKISGLNILLEIQADSTDEGE
jgi:hypothetical protein